MLEIPEAFTVAKQLNETVKSKVIKKAIAAETPHKFAFYFGDPEKYNDLLEGETIEKAEAFGGLVEIKAGSKIILIGDGAALRYHEPGAILPKKHQLLIEFEDGSALSATVQMYGGMWCFNQGEFENKYYKIAMEKPSPLSEKFNGRYFKKMISVPEVQKMSIKAFLATEQRIPGLGNGVLQDILWKVKVHPKRKVKTLTEKEMESLYLSVKKTLELMTEQGGRNTEKDLFGINGGYEAVMSKNNLGKPCPVCGEVIRKEAYLGGSIYFCSGCQKV